MMYNWERVELSKRQEVNLAEAEVVQDYNEQNRGDGQRQRGQRMLKT